MARARSARRGGTGQALPAGESPYPRANPAYEWRGWDGVCELEMVWCVVVEREGGVSGGGGLGRCRARRRTTTLHDCLGAGPGTGSLERPTLMSLECALRFETADNVQRR